MAKGVSLIKLGIESNEYEKQLRQAKRSWDEFTRGIGLSAGKFTAVSMAVGAVTGALKVAKDAFMSNEQAADEWGRTMQASQSLYEGFLQSLNGGRVDGFLSHMDDIVNAARAAYDALDELGTFNAFNQINMAKSRAGMMEAMVNYREGTGTKEQVTAAADAYKAELRERQKREQATYDTEVARIAETRGVEEGMLRDILAGKYGDFETLKELQPSNKGTVAYTGMFGQTYRYQTSAPANEREKLAIAIRALNDEKLGAVQALGARAWQTDYEINQVDRMVQRYASGSIRRGGTGGGGTPAAAGPSGPFAVTGLQPLEWQAQSLEESLAKIKPIPQIAPPEIWSPLQRMKEDAAYIKEQMELAATPEQYQRLAEALAGVEANMESFRNGGMSVADAGKLAADNWTDALSAVGSLGGALQSLEDPAARVFGIVSEAIATVALTFAKSLKGTATPWDWIAAAISGTATMISTITAIKSATAGRYAQGGVIPGNSFSGDGQMAFVNAGEVVLTRAQAGLLASQLNDRGTHGHGQPFVTGETIYLGLTNYLKDRGKGQLVTTRG